ncbi:MAG: nickel-dependent hydrogenase large subunit [Gemmatimonadota bacterium]
MTTADLAGELRVSVQVRDERVAQVKIDSTRPQVANTLLTGRTIDEALALVPRVFAICGRSQAIAARLAVEAARGETTTAPTLTQRTRAIEAEIAHEYLLRALVDWPRATGGLAQREAFGGVRDALAREDLAVGDAIRHVVERDVFAGDSEAWFDDARVPAFEIWIARAATPAARMLAAVQRGGPRYGAPPDAREVPLLPPFEGATASRILSALDTDPQFERLPHLEGRACETGAPARTASHPLVAALEKAYGRSVLTRLAARLTELARLAAGRPTGKPLLGSRRLGADRGLGWVETARGLLLHAVDLSYDTVKRYRIVAPTEWNFHPRGALAAGLVGVRAGSERELRQRTEWLVQALDPCVTYRVEIGHA